jgi:uncharacterized protein YoaH (UPF0181 family)
VVAHKGHPKAGGRAKGTQNKATLEIKELARVHGPAGITRLAEIAFNDAPLEAVAVRGLQKLVADGASTADVVKFVRGAFQIRSDQTCVAAIKELFDRGYGKAIQPIAGSADGDPIRNETKTTLIYSGVLAKFDEKV